MTLPNYLEGAVDLHVHSAPDVDRRRFNDLELALAAKEAGVGAVLIKSHQNSTVERAWLVSQCVPGIRVYGGLVLNHTVGGLNPAAVRLSLQLARVRSGCQHAPLTITDATTGSPAESRFLTNTAFYRPKS